MINIFRHFKGHILAVSGIILLLIVAAWSDLSLPQYTSRIVDIGIAQKGYVDGVIPQVSQSELTSNSINYITRSGAMMLGVAFVGITANIIATLIGSITSSSIAKELRHKVYVKVIGLSHAELDEFSTASLITRTTNDITQVQGFIQIFFRMVLYAPILSIGAISNVVSTNGKMSWTIVLGVVTVIGIIAFGFSKVIPRFKKAQKLVDQVNKVLRENLTGLSVIRAFSNQKFEEDRFAVVNHDLTENNRYINNVMSLLMPGMMLTMNLMTVLIVFVGANHISQGNLQVGEMMAFMTYAMQIMMSFIMISMVSVMLPRATVAMGRIQEVLDSTTIVEEPSNPCQEKITRGEIEFNDVTYRFHGAPEAAINKMSFVSKPGQTTAIIGSTGSGKTTILNLLLRFMDPTLGSVQIDNINIKNLPQEELRKAIAVVPQKALLFRGTIEENILFGESAEAIALPENQEKIKIAAQSSQSKEFIDNLDNGLKSEVSQGGSNFSGGQKQRLAIARALAKDAKILLFDDSFSALDYRTDRLVRNNIKENYHDKNIIIVGQRVSSIMDADQILVVDKGNIVGKGTHKELLSGCSIYQEIAKSQLSEEELNNEK